ncbi:MAG: methyltransferase [Hyphomonadaceae bacterium]|nr:methyltransferase [Hyphomonadaceae bacterium]
MIGDIPAFIRANTRVHAPPHVPEVRLHLADDAVSLWQLTEEELDTLGLPPPFWAFAWAGGQALARYVLDHADVVRGRSVLDVASGSGLVAIAAMQAGAASACAIDIDPFCAPAAVMNAALNGVTIATSDADPIGAPTEADVILVGDLFYDRDLSPRLLAWLRSLVAEGRTVLIGDPGRAYLPTHALKRVALYEVPVTRALEDAEVKKTGVWTLAPAA